MTKELENKLDSFDKKERADAFEQLAHLVDSESMELPEDKDRVNLHFHTFYSFNYMGYSPAQIAWLSKKNGLKMAGIVDFDVLDGVEEFFNACRRIRQKGISGIETRVFVPEFSDKVINSPGEPGIAYHMGAAMPTGNLDVGVQKFLAKLKQMAQNRNKGLIERVNKYLEPVKLDYDEDVLPLTPSGNATERHISLAYAKKGGEVFENEDDLKSFWSEKIDISPDEITEPTCKKLVNTIRAKTMKRGGVGYVQPERGDFPDMADFNEFVLNAGGIPTLTWLNGLSDGEQEIEKLLEIEMSQGVEAINIIPDRNFTAGVKDEKLEKLQEIMQIAEDNDLPVSVGTEMNSPGLKFVDDFESEELSPFVPAFMKGAYILYGHTLMERFAKAGYTSEWSKDSFESREEKNEFFESLGRKFDLSKFDILASLSEDMSPDEILGKLT